jgi:calcineurin-like phosphoesterase
MIGQNRQAAFQQAKAGYDFNGVELELKTNTQLTREIDKLSQELRHRLLGT